MTAVGPNSELTFWALMSAFTGCGHGRACCEDADAILFAPSQSNHHIVSLLPVVPKPMRSECAKHGPKAKS
jgi:hypothetical protein